MDVHVGVSLSLEVDSKNPKDDMVIVKDSELYWVRAISDGCLSLRLLLFSRAAVGQGKSADEDVRLRNISVDKGKEFIAGRSDLILRRVLVDRIEDRRSSRQSEVEGYLFGDAGDGHI